MEKTSSKTIAKTKRTPARKPLKEESKTLLYDLGSVSTLLEVFAEYQVDRILKLVVDKIPRLFQAKEASLFWFDREKNRILLRETSGSNKGNIGKHAYALGEGLTGWVAKYGRPLRIDNIEDKKELRRIHPELRWSDKYKGFKSSNEVERHYRRAFLAVPIKIEGITVGVLRIAKTAEPDVRFTKAQEQLFVTFADHLATILRKAELLQRADDIHGLIDDEDNAYFKTPQNLETYFRMAVNIIPTILSSSGCTIFLKDEDKGSYVLKYTSRENPLESQIGIATYHPGEGLTGWVLLKKKSLRVNDIENRDELKQIDSKLQWMGKHLEFMKHHSNFLAAPICTAREIYGVIRLSKESENTPFTYEDERLLSKYGRFLGSALQSLELEQEGTIAVRPVYKDRYWTKKDCCYVLMPYSQKWSRNVKHAIKGAVVSQNLSFRIAEDELDRFVMKDVWKGICEARIIIADTSSANPNVAYEIGLADVLGKPIVLLAQDPSKVPFDFLGTRLLVYSLARLDKLQEDLAQRLSRLLA